MHILELETVKTTIEAMHRKAAPKSEVLEKCHLWLLAAAHRELSMTIETRELLEVAIVTAT